MRKVPVQLTDLETWAIMELAKARNSKKQAHGVKTNKVDEAISDVESHYIGMKAEYAVAKTLDCKFNPENMLSGDDGFDFTYRGLSVDVKYSQLDMKFKPGSFLADIAILVQPLSRKPVKYGKRIIRPEQDPNVKKEVFSWKNVLIVGWVSRARFEREHEIRNFGYNDVEFMDAKLLSPMSDLKKYAENESES